MKHSDIWLATLNDPRFWYETLRHMRPLDEEQEARTIRVIARSAKVPASRVRKRMVAYLRGRVAEIDGEMHPGTNTAH